MLMSKLRLKMFECAMLITLGIGDFALVVSYVVGIDIYRSTTLQDHAGSSGIHRAPPVLSLLLRTIPQ